MKAGAGLTNGTALRSSRTFGSPGWAPTSSEAAVELQPLTRSSSAPAFTAPSPALPILPATKRDVGWWCPGPACSHQVSSSHRQTCCWLWFQPSISRHTTPGLGKSAGPWVCWAAVFGKITPQKHSSAPCWRRQALHGGHDASRGSARELTNAASSYFWTKHNCTGRVMDLAGSLGSVAAETTAESNAGPGTASSAVTHGACSPCAPK